jgi:TolB protein
MNADGTNPKQLTASPGFNGEPAWSPDSKRIAYQTDRRGNFDIFMINDDGSGLTALTTTPANEYDPAWSADGKRIAYTLVSNEVRSVRVDNVDGSAANASDPLARIADAFKPAWINAQ